MHIANNDSSAISAVNKILDKYIENKVEDIIILTHGKIDFCCLADRLSEGKGEFAGYHVYQYSGKSYKVSTCRKFKGLEADAIVMLDLKKDSFVGKKGLEFYVGTSRAKQRLDLVCNLSEDDYAEIISILDPNAPIKGNAEKMKKTLSNVFAADME